MISAIGTQEELVIKDSNISNSDSLIKLSSATIESSKPVLSFDVICITAHLAATAEAFAKELHYYKEVSCEKIIPVSDLAGAKMGSGGATLAALVDIVEYLSSMNGDPYHNEHRLKGKRILILHTGGLTYNPAPWLPAPQCTSDGRPQTAIGALFQTLNVIGSKPSPDDCELWVCSSEMLLTSGLGFNHAAMDWSQSGMTIFSQSIPSNQAASHGILKLGPSIGDCVYPIERFAYRADCTTLNNNGYILDSNNNSSNESKSVNQNVAMACGLVRMDYSAASVFFSLHVVPPFSSCTSFGVDDGMTVTPFSLFLHVLPALLGDEKYQSDDHFNFNVLRTHLSGRFLLHTVLSSDSPSNNNVVTYVHSVQDSIQYTRCSVFNNTSSITDNNNSGGSIILNSTLRGNGKVSRRAVVLNCALNGEGWNVGSNSVVVGLHDNQGNTTIPKNCVLQEVFLTTGDDVNNKTTVIFYGIHDNLDLEYNADSDDATFCGEKWAKIFQRTGLSPDQIWLSNNNNETERRTLRTAKLYFSTTLNASKSSTFWWLSNDKNILSCGRKNFLSTPIKERHSLSDLIQRADLTREFQQMRDLQFEIDSVFVRDVLLNCKHVALLGVYERCASRNDQRIFQLLDEIAMEAPSIDILARTFAHIADVLAAFAGKGRGLRSGPARNPAWQIALHLLTDAKSRKDGIRQMSIIRDEWRKKGPDMMIRASRHYEGGGQRLILAATSTCQQFISLTKRPWKENVGTWAVATAPARLDLSGGWSDTPPLCFEYGGAVTNIAIMIDGERPIGAKARLISEPNLVFVVGDNITTCTTLNDLSDYGTPQAPAALLKCALLSIGILEINGKMNEHSSTRTSLQEQIFLHTNGYGIELHSWSNLPTGSGLGTSSILAACIIASAARVCSIHLTEESLVHAVLLTEQLLTTGGGYQDNVGGVYGGAKICRSSNTLPLRVTTTNIPLSQTFQNVLNDHLLLIYTGRARLARNLLQNVVRRWYARLPEIVETINNLTKTAIDAANAIEKEDLIEVGENLSKYWSQKKCMAEGCEPEFVSQMIECFRKSILGASLCGAGGGGFLVVLTKKPNDIKNLQEQLRSLELNIPGIKFHKVQIDTSGLTVDTAI